MVSMTCFLNVYILYLANIIFHITYVDAGLFQTGYSVVSACVVTLRWKDKTACQVFGKSISSRAEGLMCLITVVCCGFAAGVFYRFGASLVFVIIAVFIAILAAAALHFRQVSCSSLLHWESLDHIPGRLLAPVIKVSLK